MCIKTTVASDKGFINATTCNCSVEYVERAYHYISSWGECDIDYDIEEHYITCDECILIYCDEHKISDPEFIESLKEDRTYAFEYLKTRHTIAMHPWYNPSNDLRMDDDLPF